MKRFILNILLFCIPIIIWLFVKWTQPYDLQFAAHFTKGDCFSHGIWLHDRIYSNPKPIDIAFFGTSHTINAINDELLSNKLNKNIVNCGYCRLGRNLQELFAKEVIIGHNNPTAEHDLYFNKNPDLEKIIIEIRENEEVSSHPMYPYWSNFREMLQMPYNRDYINDWYLYTVSRIEHDKSKIYPTDYKYDDTEYGGSSNADTIDITQLQGFQERHSKRLEKNRNNFVNSYFSESTYHFPKHYLNKIHQQCEQRNIELQFIYLPSFASAKIRPQHLTYYESLGKVIIPPQEIWENPNYWFDKEHLNIAGATAFSQWLTTQL